MEGCVIHFKHAYLIRTLTYFLMDNFCHFFMLYKVEYMLHIVSGKKWNSSMQLLISLVLTILFCQFDELCFYLEEFMFVFVICDCTVKDTTEEQFLHQQQYAPTLQSLIGQDERFDEILVVKGSKSKKGLGESFSWPICTV